jgi:L-ascorbate metabolism protein UlaG (beta-lactamase superfamily)
MEITWYGHSCFRLTERGLATVVTDPYDYRATGLGQLKLKADIVTVSNNVSGHNFISAVKGYDRVLTGPGEYEIGNVFITALQTNANVKRADDLPRNTIYVFEYEGVNVAHLGNLRRVPSQTEIEALGNVHVALVPVGGGAGLNAAKAAEMVSLLEPGYVIPMHYHSPGSTLKLASLSKFLKEMGLSEIEPQPSLKVSRSTVPEETRVIVLADAHQ